MEIRCKKCGSTKVFIDTKGNQTGIYCSDCGKWIKWATKDEIRLIEHNSISNAKLTVDVIAELQEKITTQREIICNLNAMNDELQAKLDKIEQIINDWNDDCQECQRDLWMYLADIKEVLENE